MKLKLESDFLDHVSSAIRDVLESPEADENTVVSISGVASLFGFVRVSEIMEEIERNIRGRVVVFFPGEYENSIYRLMDARDGWNYLAVPITIQEERREYTV